MWLKLVELKNVANRVNKDYKSLATEFVEFLKSKGIYQLKEVTAPIELPDPKSSARTVPRIDYTGMAGIEDEPKKRQKKKIR